MANPIRRGLEFWANKDIRRRAIDVMVINHAGVQGTVTVAEPMVYRAEEEGVVQPPTMSLSYEEAAELMTELWGAGIRPSGVGSSGELAATKYHLEDMRKLALGPRGDK